MNHGIHISVVVPLWNQERYIARCLQALLSQDYPRENYEVLVVDNGSDDASRTIAETYPGIKILVETERGAYAARNRGVSEARGTVIAFTDPDCIPEKNWLTQVAMAMNEPSLLVVLGRRCLPKLSLQLSLLEAYERTKDDYVLNSQRIALYYGYTNNMAVKTRLFERFGPFVRIPRGSDTIFVQRIAEAYGSGAIRYCQDMVVTHLEITSAAVYFRKMFLYGRHRISANKFTVSKPLTIHQRFTIYRNAVGNRGLTSREAFQLFGLLVRGGIMWYLGIWSRLIGLHPEMRM